MEALCGAPQQALYSVFSPQQSYLTQVKSRVLMPAKSGSLFGFLVVVVSIDPCPQTRRGSTPTQERIHSHKLWGQPCTLSPEPLQLSLISTPSHPANLQLLPNLIRSPTQQVNIALVSTTATTITTTPSIHPSSIVYIYPSLHLSQTLVNNNSLTQKQQTLSSHSSHQSIHNENARSPFHLLSAGSAGSRLAQCSRYFFSSCFPYSRP